MQEPAFYLQTPPLYTASECAAMVARVAAKQAFSPALVHQDGAYVEDPELRRCERFMEDDEALAADLFARLGPHLPPRVEGDALAGLNPRMRFMRYREGHFFGPHQDECYETATHHSKLSVILYLNEAFSGGETRLLLPDIVECAPQTGTVLVLDQTILHEGRPVARGEKHILRTDVMFAS